MRDVGAVVRKAIYDALNGNVTWEGASVPIVDEKLDRLISENTLYILFDTQSENEVPVKAYFASTVNLTLRIVQRRQATNSKTTVENVANQILNILRPTKITTGITIPAPFKLSLLSISSGQYLFEEIQSGFQISKALITTTRITHQ